MFEFVLCVITSRNPLLVKLILTIFDTIHREKRSERLTHFLQRIKTCPFSMSAVLGLVIDNTSVGVLISFFGLFIYPFGNSDQGVRQLAIIFVCAGVGSAPDDGGHEGVRVHERGY